MCNQSAFYELRPTDMKVSTRNISLIKRTLDRLYDEFNIDPLEEDVQIGDDSIYIGYPDDMVENPISVDDFLYYTSDLDHLVREDASTVRMGRVRQTILNIESYRYYYLVPEIRYEDSKITLKIVENPVLIGLVASRERLFDEDFGVFPCSMYHALELSYKTDNVYSKQIEDEIIESFLYHVAAKYDVSIEVGEFFAWEDLTEEVKPEPCCLEESSLLPYSEAMSYYSKALRIADPDMQYHHLYKIIEHLSPLVSKKVAYEKLNQKLDTLSIVSRDSRYLDSLLDLAKQYQVSLKDKELCKTVLHECIDIVSIFHLLPLTLQKDIAKRCSVKPESLSDSSVAVLEKVKNELGEIIYMTRNRIVHAKSNWGTSDRACLEADMLEMNEFMRALAKCLIVWNARQPKEFRV